MSPQLLSASSIFDAEDLATAEEQVPEWPNPDGSPGTIRFRQMTAEQSIQLSKATEASPSDGMFLIIIFSAIDSEGKYLFTVEDIPRLRTKSIIVLNRLQRVCLRLNSMGLEQKEVLKKD